MNSLDAVRLSTLLSLLAAGGGGVGCAAPAARAAQAARDIPTEVAMKSRLTIDLQERPNLQFRIDAFAVPAASRAEFEAAMHRNRAFIETVPGFMGHMVFEKTSGPTTFDIVTVAAWESPEAAAAAGERVRAYYRSIGFDMPATLARLGIKGSIGSYRAPPALQ